MGIYMQIQLKCEIPFYLANDSIWETGICRGDDFDIAKFIKHHDNNGTVTVQIEDKMYVTCHTIEKNHRQYNGSWVCRSAA